MGLFFRLWTREAEKKDVVVAFRGTWEFKDWIYGNFRWVTRFLPMDDQYSRARAAMERVFNQFEGSSQKPLTFYTTGHSLGGGLAQHALYAYPEKIDQAVAFDPSSVTGFTGQTAQNQVLGCSCASPKLNGEPRIFRVYDAYEILASQRIFHKTFFPPERHIQELRFPNAASHSMKGLAFYLIDNARSTASYSNPWYEGKGNFNDEKTCTVAFREAQQSSCAIPVTADQWRRCPQ